VDGGGRTRGGVDDLRGNLGQHGGGEKGPSSSLGVTRMTRRVQVVYITGQTRVYIGSFRDLSRHDTLHRHRANDNLI